MTVTEKAPLAPGGGNTKPRVTASKNWCFTFNNYSEEEYKLTINFFDLNGSKYIVGREVGPINKIPHLQGYVSFDSKVRPLEFKTLSKKIHWEKAKGDQEANVKYCSKEGNFVLKGFKVAKPLKLLGDDKLYEWQKEILSIIKGEPDDRKIYWYWEPTGNTGKSTFTKYLCAKFGAVPIEGKKNDILYCASEFESDIYIFDFERSMEEYISYAAMEKIKNGCFMCSKYESKPIVRNSPHIICFANFEPNTRMLSDDRWVIKRIKPRNSFGEKWEGPIPKTTDPEFTVEWN